MVNNYAYDEWGNIQSQTEGISNSFKYSGEIYDKETGLYYLRARYYDPQVGRFISEDTNEGKVTDPLSLNWYVYCDNDPINYIDIDGHVKIPKWVKEGASTVVGFIPLVGDSKDLSDGITGRDAITYEKLSVTDRIICASATVVPFVSGKTAKNILHAADDLIDSGNSAKKTTKLLLKVPTQVADHHILPAFRGKSAKYAQFFKDLKINVNLYTVTVSHGKASQHLKFLHGQGQWNELWMQWIDNHPKATAKDVFQFAGEMMDKFGIGGLKIHPYKK